MGNIIHIGGPMILLILIVVFVMIAMTSPDTANQITGSVADLSNAVQGIRP